jgi:hypothetical protein
MSLREHERGPSVCRVPAARGAAADPRASVRALGQAIGNRALGRLLARQEAPVLNPADPRLGGIFEDVERRGRPTPSQRPDWAPRPSQMVPIALGKGTRRSPMLKAPDGPHGAKCRGACGPDCPGTCKNVGTYTEEYVLGGTHYLIEFPDAIRCGTHAGCRAHDACYDDAVRAGENTPAGSKHRACDVKALAGWGRTKTSSWAVGGPPYDDWWYFVDEPCVKRRWASGTGGGTRPR